MNNIADAVSALYRAIYQDSMDMVSYLALADALEEMGLTHQGSPVPFFRAVGETLSGDRCFVIHPREYPDFVQPLLAHLRLDDLPVTVHVTDRHSFDAADSRAVYHTYDLFDHSTWRVPFSSWSEFLLRSDSTALLRQADVGRDLPEITVYMHPASYVHFVLGIYEN